MFIGFFLALHLNKYAFHVRSGGTRCEVFALSSSFTVSNFRAISLVLFLYCCGILGKKAFLCRRCSSSKPVSFANLKAVKKCTLAYFFLSNLHLEVSFWFSSYPFGFSVFSYEFRAIFQYVGVCQRL